MSQQPPDWWMRQRGPRFGCADVTIVSIASIAGFVVLLFLLLRPDAQRVLDNANSVPTVNVVRPTETPIRLGAAPTSTPAPTTAPPPTNTPQPTPSFRRANTKTECRLRQEPNFNATVVQIFRTNTVFRIYNEQRPDAERADETWARVEPEDGTNRLGWMVLSCF
jgi:hypothetical protein